MPKGENTTRGKKGFQKKTPRIYTPSNFSNISIQISLSFNEFKELATILSAQKIKPDKAEDGRNGSLNDEVNIIESIKSLNKYVVEVPPPRYWYDVKVNGVPIQIKSTGAGSADNFSSKIAILWALTDLPESKLLKINSWQKFHQVLEDYKKRNMDNKRDLFILVYDKNNSIFTATTLKKLTVLTSNGSNLPFQVCWSKNLSLLV